MIPGQRYLVKPRRHVARWRIFKAAETRMNIPYYVFQTKGGKETAILKSEIQTIKHR